MARSIWKGAISFGLVTIPVSVQAATEEKSIQFHQLHDEDGGRIRYKRVCEKDGTEVPQANIVKGYEVDKDKHVVLTAEDLESVPVKSSRAIEILQFVDRDAIDPMMFKKSYYLMPSQDGAKAYALLREAMKEDDRVGIAKISFRDKEHIAMLRFKDDAFVLETMYWPDEVREPEFGSVDVDGQGVSENEIGMARQLIDALTGEWEPEKYSDAYREGLMKVVQAKMNGTEVQNDGPDATVIDLMAALGASVDAAAPKPKRARSRKAANA